ncbi:hypothetical protein HPB47_024884 [Ixodes persulcatus]|uniref:Uncharacterized protein n=1 Tax=Ixodes persulcatus TaxID=34615 RepID=A0AC60Q2Y0_IXOPE|nr:hypothetical protein HPB47_024884 [Ixodes persulcatus]
MGPTISPPQDRKANPPAQLAHYASQAFSSRPYALATAICAIPSVSPPAFPDSSPPIFLAVFSCRARRLLRFRGSFVEAVRRGPAPPTATVGTQVSFSELAQPLRGDGGHPVADGEYLLSGSGEAAEVSWVSGILASDTMKKARARKEQARAAQEAEAAEAADNYNVLMETGFSTYKCTSCIRRSSKPNESGDEEDSASVEKTPAVPSIVNGWATNAIRCCPVGERECCSTYHECVWDPRSSVFVSLDCP